MTLQNYYQYRHISKPGWKLGWTWAKKEVIWSMNGAFATDRGNCTGFTDQIPHSCNRNPVIADLDPDVSLDKRSEHCCHGGLLSAQAVDSSNSFSSFELKVGNLGRGSLGQAPNNLILMAPGGGYTCSPLLDTDPTMSLDFGGQKQPAFSKFCGIKIIWHLVIINVSFSFIVVL